MIQLRIGYETFTKREKIHDTPASIARNFSQKIPVKGILVSADKSYDLNKRKLTYHVRIITAEEVCGNCRFYDSPLPGATKSCVNINIAPDSSTCKHYEARVSQQQEYMPTTRSLDQEIYQSENGSVITLLDKQEDDDARHDYSCADNQWLSDLMAQIEPLVQRVVRITLGDHDDEFSNWLWQSVQKSPEDVTETALARYACEFTSVPMTKVREALINTGSLTRQHGMA